MTAILGILQFVALCLAALLVIGLVEGGLWIAVVDLVRRWRAR